MSERLLILLVIGAALFVIAAVLWFGFGAEMRGVNQKKWLAAPSGREDTGPSIGGPDPD